VNNTVIRWTTEIINSKQPQANYYYLISTMRLPNFSNGAYPLLPLSHSIGNCFSSSNGERHNSSNAYFCIADSHCIHLFIIFNIGWLWIIFPITYPTRDLWEALPPSYLCLLLIDDRCASTAKNNTLYYTTLYTIILHLVTHGKTRPRQLQHASRQTTTSHLDNLNWALKRITISVLEGLRHFQFPV